jgi:hypothetical protein
MLESNPLGNVGTCIGNDSMTMLFFILIALLVIHSKKVEVVASGHI